MHPHWRLNGLSALCNDGRIELVNFPSVIIDATNHNLLSVDTTVEIWLEFTGSIEDKRISLTGRQATYEEVFLGYLC